MIWLLFAGSASAWQSECFSTRQSVLGTFYLCEGAEEQATERWIPTEGRRYKHASTAVAEHWEIWNHAAEAGGLPAGLQGAEILFEVYARPNEYIPRHPAQEDPGSLEVVGRLREIGEVTQLPDMSYSLQDWARANSDCPLDEGELDGDACHNFMGHLGALNSTHFLPQARDWYMHLHGIALERAEACAAIADSGEHYQQTVLTCEKQALVVEAVAQHYLQDAWSSGHMWERWGSPDLDAYDGKVADALAVGSFAGTWHGAKAVLDRTLPGEWDDPMCAHAPENPWGDVRYQGTDGDLHPALGDLFWHVVVQGGDYSHQLDALTTCSVAGMAEVYQATGQAHGPLETVVDAEALYGEACWGQRVTNAALGVGSLVHKGATPNQSPFGAAPTSETGRKRYGFAIATLLGSALKRKGFTLDGESAKQFRRDASKLHALVGFKAKLDPQGTQLASGGLPKLLGAKANGQYQDQGLPEWADPPGPWSPTDPDPGVQALGLMFLETGIEERCDQDLDALEALRWSGSQASAAEQAFCERMVAPHLRVGLDAGSYDPRYEPICSEGVLYSGHTNHGSLSFEEALEQYCGGVVLQDGSFEEPEARSPWSFKGGGAVGPGVYTFVPQDGAGLLDLGLNASSGTAYAIASQRLLTDVQGGQTVRFRFRVLGETPGSGDCAAGTGPTFGLRLDDGEYGTGDAFRIVDFDEWCSELQYWGGNWSSTPEWQEMEVEIPAQTYEHPILSFYLVDNTSPDYHVLIDNVELEKP